MKQILALILLTISFSAFSQSKIGITQGVNISNGFDEKFNFLKFSPRTSYNIGISIETKVLKRLSFEPTFPLSNKRWIVETSNSFQPINNFFVVPNSFQYLGGQMNWKFNLTKNIKLIAGPEINYLLRSKSNDLIVPTTSGNKWELAIFGGIEISLLDRISLHAKYSHGLTPVAQIFYTDSNGINLGASATSSRTLMLGISFYPFKIDKK